MSELTSPELEHIDIDLMRSKCCGANVRASKGSYMGQFLAVCTYCDKYCDVTIFQKGAGE